MRLFLFLFLFTSELGFTQINISFIAGAEILNVRSDREYLIIRDDNRTLSEINPVVGIEGIINVREKFNLRLGSKYYFKKKIDILDVSFATIPITGYEFNYLRNCIGISFPILVDNLEFGIDGNVNVLIGSVTNTLYNKDIVDSLSFEYGGTLILRYNLNPFFVQLNGYQGLPFIVDDEAEFPSFRHYMKSFRSIGLSVGYKF